MGCYTWFVIPLVWAAIAGPVAGVIVTTAFSSVSQMVGRDAFFSVSFSGNLVDPTVTWTFNNKIVEWPASNTGGNSTREEYKGRIAIYNNGSLLLQRVTLSDIGMYSVVMGDFFTDDGKGNITLGVYEDPWPATRSAIIGGVVGGVGGLLLLLLLLLLILMCRRKRKQKKSPPPKSNKNTKAQVETVRRVEPPPEHQRPWTTGDAVGGRNGTLNTSFHPNGNAHTDTMGRSNPAYNSYRPDLSRGARGDEDDWRMDGSSVRPPSVDEMSLPAGADFSYANRYSNSTKSQDPLDNVGFPDSLSELTNVPSNPKYRAMTAV